MKINSLPSFRGKFYTMADAHSRAPMTAGLLSEIENRNTDKEKPFFVLDGGDFLGDSYPIDLVSKMYLKFKEKNPNANLIFNLGNVELEGWYINRYDFLSGSDEVFKNFSEKGIKIVNATVYKLTQENNNLKQYIEPYVILDDVVDNENKKILITGFTQRRMDQQKDLQDTKDLLKDLIKPAIDKEKPDSVILMMHTSNNYTKNILDYAKNELKIDNIHLVTGGHPHSIEDYTYQDARILYPAPCGKACYEIDHNKNGFEFDKITPEKNHYNYNPILKSKSTIANLDTSNPLEVNKDYKDILAKAKYLNAKVANSVYTFKTRDDYDYKYSIPSELGTFMANTIKDVANADIGIMLSMDFREKLPDKGQKITNYAVNDVVNVNKDVYRIEDVTVEQLKNIFEISLLGQEDGKANSDFLEYSSNIKIDRKTNGKKYNRVAQIYIKQNDSWQRLLNKQGAPIDKKRTFTLGACSYIAKGGRESLSSFCELNSKPVEGARTRQMVIDALKKLEKNPIEHYGESTMNEVFDFPYM